MKKVTAPYFADCSGYSSYRSTAASDHEYVDLVDYPGASAGHPGAEAEQYSENLATRSEHQRSSNDSQNALWPLYRSVASFRHSCFGLDREQSTTYCSLAERIALAHFAYSHVSRDVLIAPGGGGNGGTDRGPPPRLQPIARQDATSTVPTTWIRIPKLQERTPHRRAGTISASSYSTG